MSCKRCGAELGWCDMGACPQRMLKDRQRHAGMVLEVFDRMTREDRRDQREKKAEVERDSRRRL